MRVKHAVVHARQAWSCACINRGMDADSTTWKRRAKCAETAFLNVYQKLYEAPDPAPTLSFALVRGWLASMCLHIFRYFLGLFACSCLFACS
jgi:hypothetical protein